MMYHSIELMMKTDLTELEVETFFADLLDSPDVKRHMEINEELRVLDVQDLSILGKKAFEAYKERMLGHTYDGKPIPNWEDLGDEVRAGWVAAALSIYLINVRE